MTVILHTFWPLNFHDFPQVIFEGKFYSTQAITTSNIQAMDLILEHNNTLKKYTDYRHFLDLS